MSQSSTPMPGGGHTSSAVRTPLSDSAKSLRSASMRTRQLGWAPAGTAPEPITTWSAVSITPGAIM